MGLPAAPPGRIVPFEERGRPLSARGAGPGWCLVRIPHPVVRRMGRFRAPPAGLLPMIHGFVFALPVFLVPVPRPVQAPRARRR